METLVESHLCIKCGQTFKSIKSIEFHINICIHYQYDLTYNTDISIDNIKQVVNIYNLLELYKLNMYDNVLISHILNKLYPKLQVSEFYINLNNKIYDIKGNLETNNIVLKYISYNELISIVSDLLNISTNTFCNVINTYNKCCDYFKQ